MADDKRFSDLAALSAFDANKVMAVQSDPPATNDGYKVEVDTVLNPASPSNAKLVTQKAVDDNVVHKTGSVTENITGNKTFTGNTIFPTGLLSNGLIVISQPGPKSVVLGDGQVIASDIMSCADPTADNHVGTRGYVTSNQKNIFYVGNNGDDGKDGKSLQERKLTLDSGITAAKATPVPSASNRKIVKTIDGGNYEKFSLTGTGFITLEASNAAFDIETTSSSPDGILIDDGYSVDLGFIRHTLAGSGDQAGILIKANAGPNATQVDVQQIINNTIYDDILFESAGDNVFADIDDLRQATSRDSAAIFVSDGILSLRRNKRLRGKIVIASNKKAYIDTMYFDGDLYVDDGATLYIRGYEWNGGVLYDGTGATIITDFYIQT